MAQGGARPGSGRKKGTKTIQLERFNAFLIQRIMEEEAPMVEALIVEAKKGNVQSFKELIDRAFGKVKENLDIGLDEETKDFLGYICLPALKDDGKKEI